MDATGPQPTSSLAAIRSLSGASENLLVDVRDLLLHWAGGWSLSRGRPEPRPVAGGVRIDLGLPGGAGRYVLPALDDSVIDRRGWLKAPVGTEVRTLTDSALLRDHVGRGWTIHPICELMTGSFTVRPVALPDGYTSRISADGLSMKAAVLDADGAVVSSARVARWDEFGVVDQVETSAGHRRRGLATAVMAVLGNWAVESGTNKGLLSATQQGKALYRQLGWTARGEIAGATFSR